MALAMDYSRSSPRAITVSERTVAGPAVLDMDFSSGAGAVSSSRARNVAAVATEKKASRLRAQRLARRAGDKLCSPGFMALMALLNGCVTTPR